MMRKKSLGQKIALFLGIGAVLVGVVAATGAAQAATSRTYSVTKTVKADGLGLCLKMTLYGKLEYKKETTPSKYSNIVNYSNRTLVNPTMSVKAYKGAKCRTSTKLTGATLTQRWYSYNCDINPGLSIAGPPFAVGIAPTMHCGNVTAASRQVSFTTASASFIQSNSGRPVKFDSRPDYNHRCMSVDGYVTAKIKAKSDSVKATFKVCP